MVIHSPYICWMPSMGEESGTQAVPDDSRDIGYPPYMPCISIALDACAKKVAGSRKRVTGIWYSLSIFHAEYLREFGISLLKLTGFILALFHEILDAGVNHDG